MITTSKFRDSLVESVANAFPSFGGGKGSNFNPIAETLKDHDPQFAAGVDIAAVVEYIVNAVVDEVDVRLHDITLL
jgi:hypothetical protein